MSTTLDRTDAPVQEKAPIRLRLRPTMPADLAYVLALEKHADHVGFVTPWERAQHEAAIAFADFRHCIIESGSGLEPAGYVILNGCRNHNLSLELVRIVVQTKGQGIGRAALKAVKRIAFDDLGAHRLWLDVKAPNQRARGLYEAEGFRTEGCLRDAARSVQANGSIIFDDLIVLSMLRPEFAARRAQMQELRA